MSKSQKRPGNSKKRSLGSSLSDHKQDGKTLVPPYARLPAETTLSSWREERLPDVLWAALICAAFQRDQYLDLFRGIADNHQKNQEIDSAGMGHSRFKALTDEEFDCLLGPVLANSDAIEALKPLMMFANLPDRHHWSRYLPSTEQTDQAWSKIAKAMAGTLWHQSEKSTDIRWLKVLTLMSAGKMHFTAGMEKIAAEIAEYPNNGDMKKVRPTIRATEMAFTMEPDETSSNWCDDFWTQCLADTLCMPAPLQTAEQLDVGAVGEQTFEIYDQLVEHFHKTDKSSDIDARHDSVFGIALYSMTLFITLLQSSSHQRLQGRVFLRILTELYITLKYLVLKDSDTIWKKYRMYGEGQAKLSFLKMLDFEGKDVPNYIQVDELEALANEDRWEEFVEIDLGSWAKLSLRQMSIEIDAKETYDKYYPWPSGYVHGHWTSVRDTVFDLCVNPLHRYHRIPSPPRINMPSVAVDALKLCNLILDLVNQAYPSFKPRLKKKFEAVKVTAGKNSD